MFLLLTYLETWQVGMLQLDVVLLLEVLGYGALDRLAGLELQRKRLRVRWATRDVAHAVLATHRAAVRDLDLEAFDLFGELDALCIVQGLVELVDRLDVEDLAQELDHWLRFVEGCRAYFNANKLCF